MYFKLHNLEKHPAALKEFGESLIALLSEGLNFGASRSFGILSLDNFSQQGLHEVLERYLNHTTRQWQEYMVRRDRGEPRSLFANFGEARQWLIQNAPSKYIDGAWLGHVHNTATPFAFRAATKDAWQVFSEELGDGDINMNHVHVYRNLVKSTGQSLPAPDTENFIRHPGFTDTRVWKSAVAQLLISLFPNEFLPEILGFNLHFEMLTLETMIASKELEELGIDSYYFTLHITIDNGHSGHTAVARDAVIKYIAQEKSLNGPMAAQVAWKRVQAGFALSEYMAAAPNTISHVGNECTKTPLSQGARAMIEIMRSKCAVAKGVHDDCRAKIAGRSLSYWLDPERFEDQEWQFSFLHHLSNSKPWVYKGDSGKSRLMHALSWGGKMFGSFTKNEVEVVRTWIDSLGTQNPDTYWSFTGRSEASLLQIWNPQPLESQAVDARLPSKHLNLPLTSALANDVDTTDIEINIDADFTPIWEKLLPLWFTHPCLLEEIPAIPWRTTTTTGCAVVRLLRAQHGFGPEAPIVAGTDESTRTDSIDLVDIGRYIMREIGESTPSDLQDVLNRWPSDFVSTMLQFSARPKQYENVLLGLTQAFVQLHQAIAGSHHMSEPYQSALRDIAFREQQQLNICVDQIKQKKSSFAEFIWGYRLGRSEIEKCLS